MGRVWGHKALLAGGLIQTEEYDYTWITDSSSQSPFSGRSDSDADRSTIVRIVREVTKPF